MGSAIADVLSASCELGLSGRCSLPRPPAPYSYATFAEWFKAQNWNDFGERLQMAPSFSWFDVDSALAGKFRQYLRGQDMERIASVAKAIDRFRLMLSIMQSGDDSSQSSMGMHLLTLALLSKELRNPQGVRALDIGCGTGWLLKAFALMSDHPTSRVSGFDVQGTREAAKHMRDPTLSSMATRTPNPSVFRADVLSADFGIQDAARRRLLPQGSFDIVNVGLAVEGEDSPVFQQVFDLLKVGGALTIPVLDGDVGEGSGKVSVRFRKYICGPSRRPVLAEEINDLRFIAAMSA